MKNKKIIYCLSLLTLSMTLSSCGNDISVPSVPPIDTGNSSVVEEEGKASDRPEAPIENNYVPGSAPKDYDGKSISDIGTKKKSSAYKAFFYAEHKLANSNYFTYIQSANLNAYIGSAVAFKQDVSGFRVFMNNAGFGQSITKSQKSSGFLALMSVPSAVQKYEDISANKVGYRQNKSEEKDSIEIKTGENETDGKYIYGSFNSDKYDQKKMMTKEDYENYWGHNLWGLTSYTVPSSNAIYKADIQNIDAGNSITLSYEFTTKDTAIDGVDASKGYQKEQQQMLGQATASVSVTIDSLKIELTLDKDLFPTKVHCIEEYTASAMGQSIIKIKNDIVNVYKKIESVDDISIPEYKQDYQFGINAFTM